MRISLRKGIGLTFLNEILMGNSEHDGIFKHVSISIQKLFNMEVPEESFELYLLRICMKKGNTIGVCRKMYPFPLDFWGNFVNQNEIKCRFAGRGSQNFPNYIGL